MTPPRPVGRRRYRIRSRSVTDQVVILAAGLGSRLGSAEAGVPKPLMEVGGALLIGHALRHAEASGCRDAVVVIGYEGARVRSTVEALDTSLEVRFAITPDHRAPNGHSLLAAAPLARPRFFLQMVDHVFERPVLPLLDVGPAPDDEVARLLVDSSPGGAVDLQDATKVCLDGVHITEIGKGLVHWDAIDTGCFRLTSGVFEALRAVPVSEPLTVSAAMRQLSARGAITAVPIGEVAWVDVDTPGDRAIANRLLTVVGRRGRQPTQPIAI